LRPGLRTISAGLAGSLLAAALTFALAPLIAPYIGLTKHQHALLAPGSAIDISGSSDLKRSLNVYEFGPDAADTSLILVHGVPGSAQMMIPLASALASQGYHTVAYDRLGWVHSSRRPANELADPPHNAQDLIALIRALSVEQPVLLGYSYGGGVVQEVNRLAPEIASCNILLSSLGNGRSRQTPGSLSRVIFSRPIMSWMLSMTATAKAGSRTTVDALFYPSVDIPEEQLMTILATLDRSLDIWLREGNERWIEFERFAPETIVRPTLIIHGEDDAIVPVAVARQLRDDIPPAKAVFIAGMGHAAPLTHAAEIAGLVTAFVNQCLQAEVSDRGSL